MQGDGWTQVSDVTPGAFLGALWRQKWLMLIIAAVICGGGLAAALSIEKQYPANAKLLVRFDDSYVYDPVVGVAGQGTAFQLEDILQAEVGFLSADTVKERVLRAQGLGTLYPKLAEAFRTGDGVAQAKALADAIKAMRKNFSAFTAPKSPNIHLVFKHPDPVVASDTLNTWIAETLAYRREVLLDNGAAPLTAQRLSLASQLGEVNASLEAFLRRHQIGDFEGDREALLERASEVENTLFITRANREEAEGRVTALRERLSGLPTQITVEVNDASAGRLQALRIERQELLASYLEDSLPVQAVDDRIAAIERAMASGAVDGGQVRRGVNPIRQQLETETLQAEALVQSLIDKEAELGRQLATLRERQQRFQGLFAEYQDLVRQRTALEIQVAQISSREQQALVREGLAKDATDNIRIVQSATPMIQATSLRRPLMAASVLLAGLTALTVGSVRALSKLMGSAPARAAASFPMTRYQTQPSPRPEPPRPPRGLPVLAVVGGRSPPDRPQI